MIDLSKEDANRALIAATHRLYVSEMQSLIILGVDGMFTNFPDQLKSVLSKGAAGIKTADCATQTCRNCRLGT